MRTYALSDVAKEIGIQVRTAREWLRKGKIKAKQDERNHRWLVPEDEVKRLKYERESGK